MKYSELNKTQKRCVDAFIKCKPSLANSSSISRAEVEEVFFKLYDARQTGGQKIGYPMWLVKGDKVSRGVYVWPCPTAEDVVAVETPKAQPAKKVTPKTNTATADLEKEDKEFFTDLQEYGIMETA